MDTPWFSVGDVVERTGLSRQGVNHAARQALRQVDLSRKGDNGRWLIDPVAVAYYVEHGAWPRDAVEPAAVEPQVDSQTVDDDSTRTIEDLRFRVESAELRAALAVAGESEARLAEKDVRVEMLEGELAHALATVEARDTEIKSLKREYLSLLQARSEALD